MAKKDKNSIEYLLRGELEEKKKTSRKKRKALNYMLVVLAAAVLGYAFYAFFFCGSDVRHRPCSPAVSQTVAEFKQVR